MYNFLVRNGQAVAFGLGILVIAIFLISVFMGIGDAGYEMGTDLNKLTAEQKSAIDFFNPGLWLTIILTAVAFILAIVVFGIVDLVRFPKSAIKILIGLAVIAVVFFALYSMSDVETAGKLGRIQQQFNISEGVSKFISAGLKTTIGLLLVAVAAMILGGVRNALK